MQESACFVSAFHLAATATTYLAKLSLYRKTCICYGWRCSLLECACAHEKNLAALSLAKPEVIHNLLFCTMPVFSPTFYTIPRRVPISCFPSSFSIFHIWHAFSIPKTSNGVSFVPLLTSVAADATTAPAFQKPRIGYIHRLPWYRVASNRWV